MGKISGVDKRRIHDLTIEEVRSVPIFTQLTEEQAREVIATLKQLSVIIYNYYREEKKRKKEQAPST